MALGGGPIAIVARPLALGARRGIRAILLAGQGRGSWGAKRGNCSQAFVSIGSQIRASFLQIRGGDREVQGRERAARKTYIRVKWARPGLLKTRRWNRGGRS